MGSRLRFALAIIGSWTSKGKPRQQELTLTVAEFLRRWSEHVPLPGVHTVRAWGLYASTQRPKLARCREELPEKETTWEKPKAAQERSLHNHPWEQCPVCQQPMIPVQVLPRAGAPPQPEPLAVAA